jgi:hypothetical protein
MQVLAAQNDEATNRILPELRDALHEHSERLRLRVAQEYPSTKMTWPLTEPFYFLTSLL